ncbi:hypothetical protein AB9P05_03115 [Roseivirga sp. BDSF3-8]|uniref:hypothetical protein n=1 Tax=Roseivirga sp. BDSF3-8 TaxID=3241598 RepID=UPI003532625D
MKKQKLNLIEINLKSFRTAAMDNIKAGLKADAINPSMLDCPTEQFGGCPNTVLVSG